MSVIKIKFSRLKLIYKFFARICFWDVLPSEKDFADILFPTKFSAASIVALANGSSSSPVISTLEDITSMFLICTKNAAKSYFSRSGI